MGERTIEIDYQDLKLKIAANFREGKEENILFIHGLGHSKDSFKDVWTFPQLENFSILTFDLPGFGDSSKPKEFSYKMEDYAEVCRLIIEKLNLDRIHLVCHSMGGAIALLLIKKIPERIISFFNLEGNLTGEDCNVSRKAVSVTYEEFEKSFFDRIKERVKRDQKWYKEILKTKPYGFYHGSESLVEWSDSNKLLDMFLELGIRKWYVYGDKNSGIQSLKLIKNRIRTIPISNSGHSMMLDNPQEFYKKLAGVLSG